MWKVKSSWCLRFWLPWSMGCFILGGKWTQVDDALMQPFNFADAQFALFLIASCRVNKWLDFSGAGQTLILSLKGTKWGKKTAWLQAGQLVGNHEIQGLDSNFTVNQSHKKIFLSSLSSNICFSSLYDLSTLSVGLLVYFLLCLPHGAPSCPADSINTGIYLSNPPAGRK